MSMYAYSNACSPGRDVAHAMPLVPAVPVIDPKVIDFEKSAEAHRLFALEQLEVTWEEQTGTLWTFMRPRGRPSYNLDLLEDLHAGQRGISAAFADRPEDLRYLVHGSRTSGVFNLGGDLDHFLAKIRERELQALVAYGESCVRILHRNMNTLGLPMITIGLAQGDALGGGFESSRKYMYGNKRRHAGARAVFQAGREVNPVTLEELDRIVQIWADACLQLSEYDLKVMQRFVVAQDKLQYTVQAAE